MLIVYSSNLSAQKATSQKVEGLVQFSKDSTSWIAVVIQKGVVSDVFKIGFDSMSNGPLPHDGKYRVTYNLSTLRFSTLKGEKEYIFRTDKITAPIRKSNVQWKAKSLIRINPMDYPWVEQ